MKFNPSILTAIFFLLLSALSLHARIGETPDQCNNRYGEPTFTHQKGDKEYRSYHFNEKRVHVVFYKSESVMECIIIGPKRNLGERQAVSFSTDAVEFFRGLLSEAYHFTEVQKQELAPMRRTERNTTSSGRANNGSLRALYSIAVSDREETLTFQGFVAKVLSDVSLETLTDFYGSSGQLEMKSQEKAKAKGF